MSYHGTPYKNKQMRKLLGKLVDRFVLASVKGKPARTKNQIKIVGNKVTIFGSDFIAKGYLIK